MLGCAWKVVQMKVTPPAGIHGYSFIDDSEDEEVCEDEGGDSEVCSDEDEDGEGGNDSDPCSD